MSSDNMTDSRLTKKLAIMWSHNKQKHPNWLDDLCSRIVSEESGRYLWWDVRWSLPSKAFKILPIEGYVWNTVEKLVTHKTEIERESVIINKSKKEFAESVQKQMSSKLGIRFNENSPMREFLRNEREELMLLKLGYLSRLYPPRKLEEFRFRDDSTPKTGPQGFYWVKPPME